MPHHDLKPHSGRRFVSPERVLVVCGLIFGLAFIVITPPFEVNDELGHLYRAYQVSEGHITGERSQEDVTKIGGYLPEGLVKVKLDYVYRDFPLNPLRKFTWNRIKELWSIKLQPETRRFVNYPGFPQVRYSFLTYLPQALGVVLTRPFDMPVLGVMYAARLGNLLAWIPLMALVLRILPCSKWLFLLLALTPMSLRQAASVSGDAMTNAFSFLLIATALRLAFGSENISMRGFAGLCAVMVLQTLCKPAYFVLPLLFFLIAPQKFGAWKRYLICGAVYGVLFLAAFAAVSAMISTGYQDTTPYSVHDQLHFILHHPLRYAYILAFSMIQRFILFPVMTENFIGFQSWRDLTIYLPGWLILTYWAALFGCSLAEPAEKVRFFWWHRAVLSVVGLAGIAVVFTMVYLHYNPVGAATINTVWGRMVIPVMPPLFLALSNGLLPAKSQRRLVVYGAALLPPFTLGVAATVLFSAFYIPQTNLVPNGTFADWPVERSLPSGWEPDPKDTGGAWTVERVQDTTAPGNFLLKQTCLRPNAADSIDTQLGVSLKGLRPYHRYRFFCRAAIPVNGALRITAWAVSPDKPLRRIKASVAQFKGTPKDQPGSFFGEFYTTNSPVTRLVVCAEGPEMAYPFTVTWAEWAVTPEYFGAPWRIFQLLR